VAETALNAKPENLRMMDDAMKESA
jgi:hypothetical protein